MKLWIDDVRTPPMEDKPMDQWVWAKTPLDAYLIISTLIDQIDEISFDHDLGGELTSMPVAVYIEGLVLGNKLGRIPVLHVHSMYPVGRKNLLAAIDSIRRHAEK